MLTNDAFDVVATFSDTQTVGRLCRAAFKLNELLRPRLYRQVEVRTFAQSAAFFEAIKRNGPLGQHVISYCESPEVYMPHLLDDAFATLALTALYRMPNLKRLALAHSIAQLSSFQPISNSINRLSHLKALQLFDLPGAPGALPTPRVPLKELEFIGRDERENSSKFSVPQSLKTHILEARDNLVILRLTTCSVLDILSSYPSAMWPNLHTLALDQCAIPEFVTGVFPNLRTLEVWAEHHRPYLIPPSGWPHLSRVMLIVSSMRTSHLPDRPIYTKARSVAEVQVRAGVAHHVLWPASIPAALACVVTTKLECARIGYVPWGHESTDWTRPAELLAAAVGLVGLLSWCSTVDTFEMRLRIVQARDPVRHLASSSYPRLLVSSLHHRTFFRTSSNVLLFACSSLSFKISKRWQSLRTGSFMRRVMIPVKSLDSRQVTPISPPACLA